MRGHRRRRRGTHRAAPELAGADPADVRQVVAEVLAALDRAAGGALREHLPEAIRLDAGLDAAAAARS